MKKIFTSLYSTALIALCVAMLFSSCKKKIESSPSWNTSVLAPLLKSTLSLDDLLADSLLQTHGDNSVSLVFSSNLFHQSLTDQAFEIPDTAIKVGFSLENLNLANQSIIYNLSLGTIATQLGGLGEILILANGTYFPIPPLSGITSPDNDLDATQFFETADIESGSIDISIENGLPIEMSQMIFQIRNKIDQQVLTLDTFLNLSPNEIQTKVIDLAGKHVEGTLVATIVDLSTPGGTVLIDTSDALIITMIAHDIKVSSATAVFPSQNLIDEDKLTTYKLSGGAQLDLVRMKSGTLSIKVESTIPQKSHFEYALPSATDLNGNSILVNQDLPPAP
ncbi:MAG: hypothetical protein LH473_04580, partial [Chitinophagales bacterium]|nr:hypothetical protein [Chitinophagales bacterium]